jgi:SAM-dependent methyltransferase
MSSDFDKYRKRGAYHWRELSRNPLHGWPYTRSRVEWVVRQCAGASRVLELGCGDAAILGRLTASGKEVVGVDTDPTALELARSVFAKKALRGTFHPSLDEVEGGPFDAVVLAEVIEHVDEPAALLEALGRRMTPEARLVVTTPIRLLEESLDPHHVHEFTPGELLSLLKTHFQEVTLEKMHPVWLIDLCCYTVKGIRPWAVADNLVRLLTGIELLDELSSPLSLFWTQAAICLRPFSSNR